MLVVRVELFESRSIEKKRELAEVMSTKIIKIFACGNSSVDIIINEIHNFRSVVSCTAIHLQTIYQPRGQCHE